MKFLYKYPQAAFPYGDLVETNRSRSRDELEYELLDTGVFDEDRYFDVFVEYAKASPGRHADRRSRVHNRGPEAAPLHVLPTLWFRNTWSWDGGARRSLQRRAAPTGARHRRAPSRRSATTLPVLRGRRRAAVHRERDQHVRASVGASRTPAPYVKDGINDHVVHGRRGGGQPRADGNQGGRALSPATSPAGQRASVRLRLTDARARRRRAREPFGADFDATFAARQREADEFYAALIPASLSRRRRRTSCARRWPACCGRKQSYDYDVDAWLEEHGARSVRPRHATAARNAALVPHAQRRRHLDARQVGVPVVRGVGPRVSRDRAGARRSRLRASSS